MIRKILFLLLLPAVAGAQDYVEFPDSNTIWCEAFRYSSFMPITTHFYKLGNTDTTVFGRTYRKLYRSADTTFTESEGIGGIWEDVPARKVYLGPGTASNPGTLMYHFSVAVGDTIPDSANGGDNNWTGDLLVHSIDSVLINGSYRRRINLRFAMNPSVNIPDAWVEGMGNQVRGLKYFSGTIPNNGQWNELVCMFQDGTEIYHNTTDWNIFDPDTFSGADCWVIITDVEDPAMTAPAVRFAPNPLETSGRFTLTTGSRFTGIALYDAQGRKRWSSPVNGRTEIPFNRSGLPAGVYYYLVSGEGKPVSGKLLIR